MQRRDFLAAPLAALAPISELPKVTSKRAPSRRVRGILMLVRRPKHFEPASWRDVPPVPFDVCSVDDSGRSMSECRKLAKAHNQEQLRCGACSWLVVVATDGRLARAKGGA